MFHICIAFCVLHTFQCIVEWRDFQGWASIPKHHLLGAYDVLAPQKLTNPQGHVTFDERARVTAPRIETGHLLVEGPGCRIQPHTNFGKSKHWNLW